MTPTTSASIRSTGPAATGATQALRPIAAQALLEKEAPRGGFHLKKPRPGSPPLSSSLRARVRGSAKPSSFVPGHGEQRDLVRKVPFVRQRTSMHRMLRNTACDTSCGIGAGSGRIRAWMTKVAP
jgi:hypothetical protein